MKKYISRIVIALVAVAFFMEYIDSTALVTALPLMALDFGVESGRMSIGITSYMISLAVFIPVSGWIVSIQYSPSFSDMFCFLPLCKKICLHSTKQMFTVFAVLLLICVRESSAYVNSYVVMTSTLLTVVSMYFIIALATASNCSIGNVVALLCITSRWRRAV